MKIFMKTTRKVTIEFGFNRKLKKVYNNINNNMLPNKEFITNI